MSMADLSPHPGTEAGAASIHKRTYQACMPCRRRKVRCDLGPVDDPHEPPCVRCRRESKECYFSATRRKRKVDGEESDAGDETLLLDDYAKRNGRKSNRTSGSMSHTHAESQDIKRSMTSGSLSATSPMDGYNFAGDGSYQERDPYTPSGTIGKSEDGQDHQVANETAQALFQSPINIPGDALHLLLKASGESEDLQRRDSTGRIATSHTMRPSPSNQRQFGPARSRGLQVPGGLFHNSNIDPAISGSRSESARSPVPQDTVNVWSRLRFVRAGWFTAREGMAYVKYFYDYINPLTPVSLPKVRSYADHPSLLKDEPMLTITILTIASRYMKLSGPGGQTRSFMVHEKLWTYLQDMITRMFWGQEQFGGGFCGVGARKVSQTDGLKEGLRTLGTIESLLLLNEFHPRSMHFPPKDGDDEILAPAEDEYGGPSSEESMSGGESTWANWSEPALRSGQMCWSLIGQSYVLAFELGIFGTYYEGVQTFDGRVNRGAMTPAYRRRADRIERLLYVFIVQAAGRFGLPSMYADPKRFNIQKLRSGSLWPPEDASLALESVDKTQSLWVELMVIMKTCNDRLFTSKDQTATLVNSGAYVLELQNLRPDLDSWQRKFGSLEVPQVARCVIDIEYHYINLYINSLALQAVMDEWTRSKINEVPHAEGPLSPSSSTSSAYANYYARNEQYIKEVIDSSRIILRHVVEGLLPNDQLKHAPVRAYFRIVSAAMFLLKTFALGAKQDDVAISLRLLDDTVRALRTSYVDDVHLCLRIADLLEILISSIRNAFVRLPPRPLSTPEQARRSVLYQNMDNNNNNAAPSDRFQYHSNFSDAFPNPLAGISRTYNNPHDSNINIMPPIGNTYATTSYNATTSPGLYSPNQQNNIHQHLQQQQQAMTNPNNENNINTNTPFNIPTEDDWLTLDLNPLLDQSGLSGADSSWFGPGAFGPETHNNLEVLGKLVDQGYRGDGGFGDGGMGF